MSNKKVTAAAEPQKAIRSENIISTEAQNDVKELLSKYVVQEMNAKLSYAMNNIQSLLDELKSSVATNDVSAVFGAIDEQTPVLNGIGSALSDANTMLNSIKTQGDKASFELKKVQTLMQELKNSFSTLSNDIIKQMSNLNHMVNEDAKKNGQLRTNIDELKRQIGRIDKVNSEINEVNTQLSGLTSCYEMINNQMNENAQWLKKQFEKQGKSLAGINEATSEVRSINDNIKEQISATIERFEQQGERIAQITEDVSALRASKDEIINQISAVILSQEQSVKRNKILVMTSITLGAANFVGIILLIIIHFLG